MKAFGPTIAAFSVMAIAHPTAAGEGAATAPPNMPDKSQPWLVVRGANGTVYCWDESRAGDPSIQRGNVVAVTERFPSLDACAKAAKTLPAVPAMSVPIYLGDNGRLVYVDVGLGSMTHRMVARMVIDSGASEVVVTSSVAEGLGARHEADVLPGTEWVKLADGSVREVRQIKIHALEIGGHFVFDVVAGVAPDGGQMLLGLPVLNRLGRFTIDVNARRLILG